MDAADNNSKAEERVGDDRLLDEPQFQGRKAKRADGRRRQLAILEATLRIVARDGIRAVKHRAIAKEAEVPLAATTYYFKDINDLIGDAFLLFAAKNNLRNAWLEEQSQKLLNAKAYAQNPQQFRQQLLPKIQTVLLDHIKQQVADRDNRLIEHAFLNESLRNPVIANSFQQPRNNILQAISEFLQQLGIDNATSHAHATHGLIQWLEYLLVTDDRAENWLQAEQAIACLLSNILTAE